LNKAYSKSLSTTLERDLNDIELCGERSCLSELEILTRILRSGLVKILGETGLDVLEHFMQFPLSGDMYRVFYEDPQRFYGEFIKIYGRGADNLLKVLFSTLIREGLLEPVNPIEIITLMKSGDRDSIRKLTHVFKLEEGSPIGK